MSSVVMTPSNVQQLADLALPVYALPPPSGYPEPSSISPKLLTTDEMNSTTDTAWPMGANILRTAAQWVLAPMPINPSPYHPLNPIPFPINPPLQPLVPPIRPVNPPINPLNPPLYPVNPPFGPLNPPLTPLGPGPIPTPITPFIGPVRFGNTMGGTLGANSQGAWAWTKDHKLIISSIVIAVVILAIYYGRKA